MSSILRRNFSTHTTLTKFVGIETPSFDNGSGVDLPFPFTFSNGVLDIALVDNFEAEMITTTGQAPGEESDYMASILGRTGIVTSVGTNFQNYIYAWQNGNINTSAPIRVFKPATAIQVQLVGLHPNNVYNISSTPPSGDNYTIGSPANNYRSAWIFKEPLTVIYKDASDVDQYITFRSKFHED
jgi:hypothetical protein